MNNKLVEMKNLGLFVYDSPRSRAYIGALINLGIKPAWAFVVNYTSHDPSGQFVKTALFDNDTQIVNTLEKYDIQHIKVTTDNIKNPTVISMFELCEMEYIVYAGPPGAILKEKYFRNPKIKFIHVHPGSLPEYKGSTPMYYSLLETGTICATSLFLSEELDSGEIILSKEFKLSLEEVKNMDFITDPWIRSIVLSETIASMIDHKKGLLIKCCPEFSDVVNNDVANQGRGVKGTTYYVIHPVLKHAAVLAFSHK